MRWPGLSLVLFSGWLADLAFAQTRSHKRGLAYAMTSDADFDALTKLSWWYNWHHSSAHAADHKDMEFVPMLWNFNFVLCHPDSNPRTSPCSTLTRYRNEGTTPQC